MWFIYFHRRWEYQGRNKCAQNIGNEDGKENIWTHTRWRMRTYMEIKDIL